MNSPRRPRLPKLDSEKTKLGPHPLTRPDERKEGGPDFGKAEKQHDSHDKVEEEAVQEAARDPDKGEDR
jgi:hypothetical protein